MDASITPEVARHGIGVVARRTGLLADRIRVWERRYGAVEPVRSATGRRLYSDADVDRLRLLREVVDRGHAIGAVARLEIGRLAELAAVGDGNGGRQLLARRPEVGALEIDVVLERALAAVRRLDRRALERELEQAAARLPCADLVECLVAPLMTRVGELWRQGEMRPVQEHMASAVLRSWVGRLAGRGRVGVGGPRVVVSTPLRQRHEMGAAVVAACATAEGWQAIYLGPDVPAEEIAAAARTGGARVVALSITFPPDDEILAEELVRLGRLLGGEASLLVGGQGAVAYGEAIETAGAQRVDGLAGLRRHLAALADDDPGEGVVGEGVG